MMLKQKILSALNTAVKYITVPKCVACGEILAYSSDFELCGECLDKWENEKKLLCERCGRTARNCQCALSALEKATPVGKRRSCFLAFYEKSNQQSVTSRLIFALKTRVDRRCVNFFAREISEALMRHMLLCGEDIKKWRVTFPPRSKKSQKKYGFDQARELAQKISFYTGAEFVDAFRRRGNSVQKQSDRKKRLENSKNAYKIRDAMKISGNRFLLVDDVITSGATVSACIELLFSANAEKVFPVAVCKNYYKSEPPVNRWLAQPLKGAITGRAPKGARKV